MSCFVASPAVRMQELVGACDGAVAELQWGVSGTQSNQLAVQPCHWGCWSSAPRCSMQLIPPWGAVPLPACTSGCGWGGAGRWVSSGCSTQLFSQHQGREARGSAGLCAPGEGVSSELCLAHFILQQQRQNLPHLDKTLHFSLSVTHRAVLDRSVGWGQVEGSNTPAATH